MSNPFEMMFDLYILGIQFKTKLFILKSTVLNFCKIERGLTTNL